MLLRIFFYFIVFFIFALGNWINYFFGSPSFEQIIYHLQFGVEGITSADISVISSFSRWCILLPLLYGLLLAFAEKFFVNTQNDHFNKLTDFYNIKIKPIIDKIFNKASTILSFTFRTKIFHIIILSYSLFFLANKVSFFQYLEHMKSGTEDFFANNYIDPQNVEIKSNKKPKNLVLIYVESLENTFADEEIFGENLLSEISPEKIGGQSFEQYSTPPTAGWTTGAIVTTQCSIPLKTLPLSDKGGGNSFKARTSALNTNRNFMPGAICLGDILEKNGYTNIFINGPDLNFAGIGPFFRSHGYEQVLGSQEMLSNGILKEKTDSWSGGLHDQELLELAQSIVTQQENGKKPYNLTILTVDTHSPDGTASPKCPTTNSIILANAVKCTSASIAKFVNFMKEKGYLKNTEVVILGDHLFMANPEQMTKYFYKNREVFNRFISQKNIDIMNRKQILHFDLLPTILYSLGFSFPDNKLGLGFSGFGPLSKDYPSNRLDKYNKFLLYFSKKYTELWNPSKTSTYFKD